MAFSNANVMSSNVAYTGGYGVNMPDMSAPSTGFNIEDLALGAQGIGAVTAGLGAYDSTAARKNMLNLDAQIADWQSSQALFSGQAQEEASRMQTGSLFGRQRAQLAANGVQLGSGSALDLLSSTKFIGDVNATTIHNNALRTAWGLQTQATIDRSAAGALNPSLSGMTTLLGGAGSVAGSWYRYNGMMNGATVPTS